MDLKTVIMHQDHNYCKPSQITTDPIQSTSENVHVEFMDTSSCNEEEVSTTPILHEFLTFHKMVQNPVVSDIIEVPEPSSEIIVPRIASKTYSRKIVSQKVSANSTKKIVLKTYFRKNVNCGGSVSCMENIPSAGSRVYPSSEDIVPYKAPISSSEVSSEIQVPSAKKPPTSHTTKRRKTTPNTKVYKKQTVEDYFTKLIAAMTPFAKSFLEMQMNFRSLKKSERDLPVRKQFDILMSNIKPTAKLFVMMQIKMSKLEPEERDFTYNENLFALGMLKADIHMYLFFKKNFILPTISSLKNMIEYKTVKNVDEFLRKKLGMRH